RDDHGDRDENHRGDERAGIEDQVSLELRGTPDNPLVRGAVDAEDRVVDELHIGAARTHRIRKVEFVGIWIRHVRVGHGDHATVTFNVMLHLRLRIESSVTCPPSALSSRVFSTGALANAVVPEADVALTVSPGSMRLFRFRSTHSTRFLTSS